MKRFRDGVCRLGVCLTALACCTFGHDGRAIGSTAFPARAAPVVKAQDPRVWAGVSASVRDATTNAMFSVGEVNRLVIGVALVNDGDAPIPFDRATTRLLINGEAVEIFDGTGPVWNEVRPGKPFGGSMGGVGKYFSKPGLYKVQWKGEGFASALLEIRVTKD